MGDLRFAIVGLGDFGMRYARALQRMFGVTVRWGCDLDEGRRGKAAAELELRTTSRFEDLLEDADLDAVIVTTPEAAHRDVAVAALDAGKHTIVEKPMATREEDARAMIAASERSSGHLIPAMLLRFDYRYAQLRDRLTEIGQVHNIYAWRNFDQRLFSQYAREHSLIENAIHDIDLVLWYTGATVERAHGYCRNTLGLENPDVNWGVMELSTGALAVVQTSWLYPEQGHRDLQWNAGIQVMGERGVLEASNDAGGYRANIAGSGILLLDQTAWADIHGEPRGAFGAMLRHFVAVLREESTYVGTTPEEALEGMRAAQMMIADAIPR